MNLNFTLTSALLLSSGVFFSVIFFTEIYTEIYPILFLVFVLLLVTSFRSKKIVFTKKILTTVFLFSILILYYLINKNNGLINDHDYKFNTIMKFNILYSLVTFFSFFMIGYFYSFQFEFPIKILAQIFTIQMICYFIYVLYLYSNGVYDDKQFNLGIGFRAFLFLPYFMIAFNLKNKKKLILLYVVTAIFLFIISNRGSFVAITMFFISYSIYPYLIKKKFFFKSYFFINLFFIFIIYFLYLTFYENEILKQLSLELFDKRLNTRAFIWIDLLEIIKQKYWLGYGSDQISSNIYYEGDFRRKNLSSHSSFFEIVLTGGLLGLFMYLLLFYSIFIQFFSNNKNYWGRVGSSFLIGLLYIGVTEQTLVYGNIVNNFIIWLFIAISIGQVTKANNFDKKINNK